MVGTTLVQELNNYIQVLHEQGLLDQHFDHVRTLQNEENPRFVTDVISMFFHDAEIGIAEITRFLNSPHEVEYAKVMNFVHQLKGGSSSIGGHKMALACRELGQAAESRNRERCLEIFERVKQEYNILREILDTISQMERNILNNETRRR